jgi:hypothetical protein
MTKITALTLSAALVLTVLQMGAVAAILDKQPAHAVISIEPLSFVSATSARNANTTPAEIKLGVNSD